MSYTAHEWTTGETITAAKMNNIEEGIAEAAESGGGGYDIVVSTESLSNTVSDYTVEWDYNSVLQKVRNGEPVTGILIYHYNYDDDVDGGTNVNIIPLSEIGIGSSEGYIYFSKVVCGGNFTATQFHLFACMVELWFSADGEFYDAHYAGANKMIS